MRAYIYARRSKAKKGKDGRPTEDEALSLAAQLRACRAECAKRGWTVAAELVEDDRSARYEVPSKRALFQQLLAGAESGQVDVVVVHKLDRFSRNLRLTLQSLDRLAGKGVGLVSVVEALDYSSPQGRLSLHMFGALAQFYSENLGQEVKKVKSERKERGLYNGILPFGVVRGPDGLPAADPHNHPGLLLAFRAAAEGQSDGAVARALNAAGYRTTGNRGHNLWTKDSVRVMLLNRFYLADLPDGRGGWLPGAHAPLVDPALFESALAARERNRTRAAALSTAPQSRPHSLTGLLFCGHCGGKMRIWPQHSGLRAVCANRNQGLDCPQRSLPLSYLDEQIAGWLEGLRLPDEALEVALARLERERGTEEESAAERRHLESRLARIKELYGWGDLERGEYTRERDDIKTRLAALAPVEARRADLSGLLVFLRSLPRLWRDGTDGERHNLAVRLLARVVVKDETAEEIIPRPEFAPLVGPPSRSGGSDGRRISTGVKRRYLVSRARPKENPLPAATSRGPEGGHLG